MQQNSMVTLRARFTAELFLLIATVCPFYAQIASGLDSCTTVTACLKLLDKTAARSDGSISPTEEQITRSLKRFGADAKRELLRRAVGNNRGWRNLSGAVLYSWGSWSESDVPQLTAALRKQPGGWFARPLGEIGTPDAIQALVEDLPKGSDNQTEFALSHLGPKVLPYLNPLLERKSTARSAQRVIAEMGDTALSSVPGWVNRASDDKLSTPARRAALRAIAAVGRRGRSGSDPLTKLLSSQDAVIRSEALATLEAVRHPIVVQRVATGCRPKAAQFDPLAIESLVCLREIAAYEDDGRDAGPAVLRFLSSKNAVEQGYGVSALTAIGYTQGLPQIEALLTSRDWRVVYASARAVGWLGDKKAIPQLRNIASSYWLSEVRDEANRAIAALQSPKGRLTGTWRFIPSQGSGEAFEVDEGVLKTTAPCRSGRWLWNGTTFQIPIGHQDSADVSLPFAGGTLRGTNHGEWGGELSWSGGGAKPVSIHRDNVSAIVRNGDTALVLFGLSHLSLSYGYLLRVSRNENGTWNTVQAAFLPREGTGLAPVAPGVFATLSSGRAIVFNGDGILGAAVCDARSK